MIKFVTNSIRLPLNKGMKLLINIFGRFPFRYMAGMYLSVFLCLAVFPGYSQQSPPSQGIIQGIVTNTVNGNPVIGAKISVGTKTTFSTGGGIYFLTIDSSGVNNLVCVKSGFDQYDTIITVPSGGVIIQNISLLETPNPVQEVDAVLDSANLVVHVSWPTPVGPYELLYDDGIQENFSVWATAGNMNAVKFSSVGFPSKVTGGVINIGTSANYPAGSNPLVAFQVGIFDATGNGGVPGNMIAGPFNVLPASLGWVEFTFPQPVIIQGGDFYLVMIQGGNVPNAAGIAIDETNPQLRSYSHFVSGGSTWFPASGNLMMRARMEGPGGPPLMDAQQSALYYQIFRLHQGEELNPAAWVNVMSTTYNTCDDNSWADLPCGPYRWGVKAFYAGDRVSANTFSNVVGKCWTVSVSLQISLSCEGAALDRTSVKLVNLTYPDTVYTSYPDTTGLVPFQKVWKGTYQLTIQRFGYESNIQTLTLMVPTTIYLQLMQIKTPPTNLVVNDSSLMARWEMPFYQKTVFTENWTNGNFTANGWTQQGGTNWTISATLGNPAPSAQFNAAPSLSNYNVSLLSKSIDGEFATALIFKYDIYLDNYATTNINQMAVEIWNGTTWTILKNYTNSGGDFTWTTEEIDISAFSGTPFNLRFRAYGTESYDINNWNLDNISVTASEPAQQQAQCILGYYFYLGNAISGYTTKNGYQIPGNQVQYGTTYDACVRALYANGYSALTCTTFTSYFLWPATNIQGQPIENTAYITWNKPKMAGDSVPIIPPGLLGYSVYRDDSLIAVINNPDTLFYYDAGLEPGVYHYGVAARYDLTPYGFAGQTGEAIPAGPLHLTVNFGRGIPFYEPWDEGSFSFNEWRFTPAQANWSIFPADGNPAPSAVFSGLPVQMDYSFSLESPVLNAVPFGCAGIWLDFQLKLINQNPTGNEKMIVETYYNNSWHKGTEIVNTNGGTWAYYHLDLSVVKGKGFRIRFRAEGQNSADIEQWALDNIKISAICYPASNLEGTAFDNTALLTWKAPVCYEGTMLNEGFEEADFPPVNWTRQTTNTAATWVHTVAGSKTGVHSGEYSAGLAWDYYHQDEWLIAHHIYISGDLRFWSYAFQGSLHGDHYYVKASTDQGLTWEILLDLSTLPTFSSLNGLNDWVAPYLVDLSYYLGQTIEIAWNAVDGDGNGLWYPWAIDDCSVGTDKLKWTSEGGGVSSRNIASGGLIGYDVYRSSMKTRDFIKINDELVTDTFYYDPGLPYKQFWYYIKSQFIECEDAAPSDTVLVDIITQVESRSQTRVSIFPNPVSSLLTISSEEKMNEITLFSASGIELLTVKPDEKQRIMFNVTRFDPGIYILQIRFSKNVQNFKICITNN